MVDVRVEYPRLTETRNFEEHLSEYPLHFHIERKLVAISRDQLDDQYKTVTHLTDSQLRFLIGVTEFYRACTDTKMTIAADRLAVIAALTLPITSLSSVMGMNVIVNDSARWMQLIIFSLIMRAISLILLRWARKQGWL